MHNSPTEDALLDQLVAGLGASITEFYASDPQASADYTRIVNEPQFHRVEKLLDSGTVAYGGITAADTRYIAPTVLTGLTAVDSLDEAIAFVNAASAHGDTPLALYTFSENDAENDRVLADATSEGACVNGTLLHISNPNLPFGGVGESGMGSYHGKFGRSWNPALERTNQPAHCGPQVSSSGWVVNLHSAPQSGSRLKWLPAMTSNTGSNRWRRNLISPVTPHHTIEPARTFQHSNHAPTGCIVTGWLCRLPRYIADRGQPAAPRTLRSEPSGD